IKCPRPNADSVANPFPGHERFRDSRQVGEAADDRFGSGFGELVGMAGPAVGAASEADYARPGRLGGADSENRILDDDRLARRHAELLDGILVDVGRRLRLAVADLDRRVDMRREEVMEPRLVEHQAEALAARI